MGVDDIPDRPMGRASDLGHDLFGCPGEVRINYQDVILELDPHAVCRLALVPIALPKEDAGGELPGGELLPGQYTQEKRATDHQQQGSDSHALQCTSVSFGPAIFN
jgi:hypothetical protein